MQIEKWSHIIILVVALALLIYLKGREEAKPWIDTPAAYGVSEIAPAAETTIDVAWLLPPYPDMPVPVKPQPPAQKRAAPQFFTTRNKSPLSLAPAKPVISGAVDSVNDAQAGESVKSMRKQPSSLPEEEKIPASGVHQARAAQGAEKSRPADANDKSTAEVHREVVQMVKSYLEGQQALVDLQSKPVVLASTQGISAGGISARSSVKGPLYTPRYIIGMDVGLLRPQKQISPTPQMGRASELYLGYEFSRLLQMGVCMGYTGISWPAAAANGPKALYATHLQAKLFMPKILKIRPFLLVGAGGQWHAMRTGADSTMTTPTASYLTRSISAGIGAEYKIISRVALQVVGEYRWNNGPLNKSLQPQQKDNYWQVKAGMSFYMGGGGKALEKGRAGTPQPGSVANL